MTDDACLAARAAAGDDTAFGTLVRRHTRPTARHRVALRITGSAAEAEDVVQDSWLAAWRSLPDFRHESAVSTWLYRVVTNSALALLRRRRPTMSLDAPEPAGQSTLDSALFAAAEPGPEGRVVRAEEVGAALRAIGRLEVSQRVPLVLRELEGLSYEEVAEVLGVNVGALRSRLHRARVALLAELRERC